MNCIIQPNTLNNFSFGAVRLRMKRILTYWTLPKGITLEIWGTNIITLAWFTALEGESIIVGLTNITAQTCHTRTTQALTRIWITGLVEGTNRITITRLTTLLGTKKKIISVTLFWIKKLQRHSMNVEKYLAPYNIPKKLLTTSIILAQRITKFLIR